MVCLLVGEGDFSFALALAAQQRDPAEELVASCPRGCVDEARANVDKLTAMVQGACCGLVLWCELPCAVVRGAPLQRVTCVVPATRGRWWRWLLLADLSCTRFCPSVRQQDILRVATETVCRGGAKGFHTEGALTHVFCLVGSAIPVLPSAAPSATCAEQNLVATRIRSLMAADKNPLGRTVHHVAKMLELGVGDLITSWAAQEEVSATDAVWRCRLERSHTCSPTKPPFSHILDIDISDPARLRDVLCLLQDICRHNLTFHAFSLLQDSVDTEGCHGYCRGLLVATLMCQTPLNSPTAEIPVGKNISSLNPMTSCSATFEENSCSLQTSACNLLSDCLRSLNFDDDRTAHPVFPCKISLHIELLSLASSSLSDWRLLLPQPGPKPLFPTASFTHDLSFWLGEGFDQGNFLTFILNKVGDLLRSMDLIDDYLDSKTGRRSQCFRLCYQSLWKALSQEAARDFHLALGVDVSQVLPVTVR
ncbi:uncharacterized protein LOC119402433 isoform X3 [Rhipicephalus sanguineus]|uniref:uncharacterized protein LOC119402433 isoform X3 n=1 Tax=Rhipicephalus sanguineus TaxID=34632 RepID=UPI001895B1E7|nr:uncharacterized protein LOC119402433 isoform X3 [Rhipicephalus sanguineus]